MKGLKLVIGIFAWMFFVDAKAQQVIQKIPTQFRFVDFNNDNQITQDEVDFVVNSKLDNVAKYPPQLLDEFVNYITLYQSNPQKADSVYNNVAVSTKTVQESTHEPIPTEEDEWEGIVTDRPDQTEATNLTPKGWFQIELGAQSEFDEDDLFKVQSTLFNTTLWKYGLTKSFEFRLITEYGEDKFTAKDTLVKDFKVSGLQPVAVGCKIKIHEGRGIIPSVSIISHLDIPLFASKDYLPEFTIPRFRFCFAHDITDRIAFSYNAGIEWEEGASNATYIYTGSLAFALHDRVGMFLESYGYLRESSPADHRLDGGITFLITDNLQLDTSGGIGVSDISPDYFLSAGISWRFNAFDKKRTFQGKLRH
jgi:hypothetical protein